MTIRNFILRPAALLRKQPPTNRPESTIYTLRAAEERDVNALHGLINASARALLQPHYSDEQIEGALGTVFAVDRQLIADGTFYVAECDSGTLAGCGGWSRRLSLYGGDDSRPAADRPLDPESEPARIRAFFVAPEHARRGIGRMIMNACEEAIAEGGFRSVQIMATPAGEFLYARFGYVVVERTEISLENGVMLPVCRMVRVPGDG